MATYTLAKVPSNGERIADEHGVLNANLDKINPGSVILSGVMMFEYMGWNEVAA